MVPGRDAVTTEEPKPVRVHRVAWSRTVIICALGIVAVTTIALTRDIGAAELGMCLMAIREAIGAVAERRPESPGVSP